MAPPKTLGTTRRRCSLMGCSLRKAGLATGPARASVAVGRAGYAWLKSFGDSRTWRRWVAATFVAALSLGCPCWIGFVMMGGRGRAHRTAQ